MILSSTTSYVKFITAKVKVLCGNNLQFSTLLNYLAAGFLQVTACESSSNRSFWYSSFWWNCASLLCEREEEQQSGNYGTLLTSTCQQREMFCSTGLLTKAEKKSASLFKTLQKIKKQRCKWSKVVKDSCVTPVKWPLLARKYRCAAKMQPQLWKTKQSQNSNTFVNNFKYLTLLVCWMLLI